jgi:hypothetical protein
MQPSLPIFALFLVLLSILFTAFRAAISNGLTANMMMMKTANTLLQFYVITFCDAAVNAHHYFGLCVGLQHSPNFVVHVHVYRV